MNYAPNVRHWKAGDLVVHDCDAKKPDMLMRVTGYTRDGLCKTEYVHPERCREWKRRNKGKPGLENELKYLHDPAQFDLIPTC